MASKSLLGEGGLSFGTQGTGGLPEVIRVGQSFTAVDCVVERCVNEVAEHSTPSAGATDWDASGRHGAESSLNGCVLPLCDCVHFSARTP